ncbi:uncharacterized protein LOC121247263 [Juglans microcarpa x Juglans regia]|uniref:uncharacterized protein LOC121247263 n=1 Tax=Juglans microcarpa x Juglans regia TaxID=2249226 RepID=UPI001B7DCB69|nr:uncharacterized protein LOC121247263 [Juglans microcarpa x Juglans regia]
MEEIEDLCGNLCLTEEDETIVECPLGSEEEILQKGERSLVGKICADRAVGKEIITNTMRKNWRISKRTNFFEVEKDVFIITFANHTDRQRVLEGKPWLFDNYLFIRKPYEGGLQPGKMIFNVEYFWLQIYNLPLGYMTKEWGERIGKSLGQVLDVDVDEDGIGWGKYLKVQVELNLQKPITQGRIIMVQGKKLWLPFKYDKLPHLCFICGWILHGVSRCTLVADTDRSNKPQFGPWLLVDDIFKRWTSFSNSDASSEGKMGAMKNMDPKVPVNDGEGSVGNIGMGRRWKESGQGNFGFSEKCNARTVDKNIGMQVGKDVTELETASRLEDKGIRGLLIT